MGEMFLQNISNKTAQQLMCICTIAVGRLSCMLGMSLF